MPQTQDAAAGAAAELPDPVSIDGPAQLLHGTTNGLSSHQQQQQPQRGSALFSSLQAAALPADAASLQECDPQQRASVLENDIASVFDFL